MTRVFTTRMGIFAAGIVLIAAIGYVFFEGSLRRMRSQAGDLERYSESLLFKPSQDHGDVRWYCNEVNGSGQDSVIREEEYKVYSDFMEQYRAFSGQKLYVVGTVKRHCGDKEEEFQLENKFPGSPQFEKIISGKELEDIQGQIRNADIGSPSSNAIVGFSRVGFNRDRTKAVIRVDFQCGPLCGETGSRVLKMENGKWVLTTAGVLDANNIVEYTGYY